MAEPEKRDVDLTIWAIVAFFGAASTVLLAVGLLTGRIYERLSATLIPFLEAEFPSITALPFWPPGELLFIGAGIIALAIAALFAVTGYGIYVVKPWARYLALLCGFLLLPGGIGIVILWYFFRADIKQTFAGKA